MQGRPQGKVRWWVALLWAGLWLVASGSAQAQRTEGERAAARGVYQAEVAVRNQSDGEREKAYGRALAQVLGNVTGDQGVAQRPGVADDLQPDGHSNRDRSFN